MTLSKQIIKDLLKHPPQSERDILFAKRKLCKLTNTAHAPTNTDLLVEYKKLKINNQNLHHLLIKRQVRTLSGIAPIAVLTKPYPCPGNCAYCPNEKNMPKSYLSNEPAVMRALLCKFNPYEQVQLRLRALTNNGHATDKLELIVMGGTWSFLPKNYRYWYIKECFRAANDFPQNKKIKKQENKTTNLTTLSLQLKKEQRRNQQAGNRIIGLTLETRPDYINKTELWQMRQLGCTRIEIGVQHIDDKILSLNQRGHGAAQTIQATRLMRQFGFKITYHIMLNLPGSTVAKDFKMFQTIYNNPHFQPDQIKIYPTVVAKGALIYQWHKQKKWRPYSTRQLINLIIKIKSITPPWVRIIRVIRDIPEESIIAGNKITNLRQIIKSEMEKKKIYCNCIRCREAGHALKITNHKLQVTKKSQIPKSKIIKRKYKVNQGTEYFLSFESKDKKILYAFCRLFLPQNSETALIRELHTYGQLRPIDQKTSIHSDTTSQIQHTGLGKKLLAQAEIISQQKKYQRLKIISGIGVRSYYRQLGYRLSQTYMVKQLT